MSEWATDGVFGLVLVEEGQVMVAMDFGGKRQDLRAADAHVVHGKRYARTAEAARKRGWKDMADFIELTEMFRQSKGKQ